MTNTPFSIRIFVADGDPEGLRIAERSNWVGKTLAFPRSALSQVISRNELEYSGVYLLLGTTECGEGEMLYVGETEQFRKRLDQHQKGGKKDFWTNTLCFTSSTGQLNKAQIRYLEHCLVMLAAKAKRVSLENAVNPSQPTLSEVDKAEMDVFLSHMLEMLPVLGVTAFEQPATPMQQQTRLFISTKGINAKGYESSQGFVVEEGSQVISDEVPSMPAPMSQLRQELKNRGVLVEGNGCWVFSQNYSFKSPSSAAAVVMGRSANGRVEWKTRSGTTLKALQSELVAPL